MKLAAMIAFAIVCAACTGCTSTYHDEAAKQCVNDGGLKRYGYADSTLHILCTNGTSIDEEYRNDGF